MSRRFAVILAADVVDYSLMMGEDEESAINLIRDLRDVSLEPLMARHGGEVLKRMGDGWIIAFSSVGDAVKAALGAQRRLAGHPKLRLRMGIHMGDIVEDEMDIYGAGVNLAARLQTEAPPGGVMISADLRRQLSSKQAEEFVEAGTFKLKNIAEPVLGFQWRPQGVDRRSRPDDLPVVAVETFAAAPSDEMTVSAAEDLREQIIHGLFRRTGMRVRDVQTERDESATYALRGRVRSAGGRVRSYLSLVLNHDGETRWSQRYEGPSDDIFAFVDSAAAKADADLRIFMNSLDNVRIADLPDDKLSVSELRTRGAALFYETSVPALLRCRSVMERACRMNPDDAMALGMWAEAEREICAIRFESPTKQLASKLAEAHDRAIELTPKSDFAYAVRSMFRSDVTRDAKGALADAERSLSINPNYTLARSARGAAYALDGVFERAVVEFGETTQRKETDSMWSHRSCFLAILQFLSGDSTSAIATMRDLIDLRPSIRAYRRLYARLLREAGETSLGEREAAQANSLSGEPNYHVQPLPLPDEHIWLLDLLAPDRPPQNAR